MIVAGGGGGTQGLTPSETCTSFADEVSVVAYWDFEDASWDDEEAALSLTPTNSPTFDVATPIADLSSASFTLASNQTLSIANGSLPAGFPMTGTVTSFTILGKFRTDSTPGAVQMILSKYNSTLDERSFAVRISAINNLEIAHGTTGGVGAETDIIAAVSTGVDYAFAYTEDGNTGNYTFSLYNLTSSVYVTTVGVETTASWSNTFNVDTADFQIGNRDGSAVPFGGEIDDIVLANTVWNYDQTHEYFTGACVPVADITPPQVSTVTIENDGFEVVVVFNEAMVMTGYDAGDLELDCSTTGNDIDLTSPTGSGNTWSFTSASEIQESGTDTCTLEYDASVNADDMEDEAGNDLLTFDSQAVTNNSLQGIVAGDTFYVAELATGDESGIDIYNYMSAATHNVSSFNPGATIYLSGTINTQITIPSSGSTGNYIKYASNPSNPALIDLNSVTDVRGIYALAKSWIWIDGLEITDFYGTGAAGILLSTGCTNVKVTNNEVHDGGTRGIWLSGNKTFTPNSDIIIGGSLGNGNVIYNIDGNGGLGNNDYSSACSDVMINWTSNVTVSYNHLYGTGDYLVTPANGRGVDGIMFERVNVESDGTTPTGGTFLIERNLIHDHNYWNPLGAGGAGSNMGEDGIDIKNSSNNGIIRDNHVYDHFNQSGITIQMGSTNNAVYRNYVHNSNWSGILSMRGQDESYYLTDMTNTFWGNIVRDSATGISISSSGYLGSSPLEDYVVHNNTTAENGNIQPNYGGGIVVLRGDRHIVKNNVFWHNTDQTGASVPNLQTHFVYLDNVTYDYNYYDPVTTGQYMIGYYTTAYLTLEQFQGGIYLQEANGVEGDSGMVDPANHDYEPDTNSPLIDGAGLDMGDGYALWTSSPADNWDPTTEAGPSTADPDNSFWPIGAIVGVLSPVSYQVSQTGIGADLSVAEFNALTGNKSDRTYYFEGIITSQVTPNIYGTSGHPVVLDGYEAGDGPYGAVINRGTHDNQDTYGIRINSQDWVTVQDFEVTDTVTGISVVTNCNNILIRRNKIHYISGHAIHAGVTSGQSESSKNTYITVGGAPGDGNIIYDTGVDTAGADIAFNYTDDWIASYNILLGTVNYLDHGTDGIVPVTAAVRGLIEHNLIRSHNDNSSAGLFGKTGDGENAIDIKNDSTDASRACHDIIIRYNYMYDHQYEMTFQIQTGTYNTRIYGNVIHNGVAGGINFYEGANNTNVDKDMYDHYVWANLVYDIEIGGIRSKYSNRNAQMWGFYIWNNTLALNGDNPSAEPYKDGNISLDTLGSTTASFAKNNLLYKSLPNTNLYTQIWSRSGFDGNFTIDNNLYRWPSQTSYIQDNAETKVTPGTKDSNAVIADSTQVMEDPANDDFTLSAGSPAINAGADLSAISIPSITVQGVVYTFDPDALIDPSSTWSTSAIPSITMTTQGASWNIGAYAFTPTASSFEVSQDGTGADLSVSQFNALSGDYSDITFYFEDPITSSVVPAIYGTSGHPVVLDGYEAGDCDPITDGNCSSSASLTGGIKLGSNVDYIAIQDFDISNIYGTDNGCEDAAGIDSTPSSAGHDNTYITVQRNYVHDTDSAWIWMTDGSGDDPSNWLIANNLFEDFGRTCSNGNGTSGGLYFNDVQDLIFRGNKATSDSAGIYTSANTMEVQKASDVLIEYNDLSSPQDSGCPTCNHSILGIKEGTPGNTNVIIRFNKLHDAWDKAVAIGFTDGIYVYGNNIYDNGQGSEYVTGALCGVDVKDSATDVNIWANIIENNARRGIFIWERDGLPPDVIRIINNTIYGNGTQNDSSDTLDTGIAIAANPINLTIKNNILSNNRPVGSGYTDEIQIDNSVTGNTYAWEHNTYYYPSETSIIYWTDNTAKTVADLVSSYGYENYVPAGADENPLFTTAGSDFTLQPGSPCINDGASISNSTFPDYAGRITITVPGEEITFCEDSGTDCDNSFSWSLLLDPDTDWSVFPSDTSITLSDKDNRGAYAETPTATSYQVKEGEGGDLSVSQFNALSGDYSGTTFYFEGLITSSVVPAVYGTSGHPVVLDGYEAGDFDPWGGGDSNAILSGATAGIRLTSGINYITIQDFRMTEGASGGDYAALISFGSRDDQQMNSNITVRRNYLYDASSNLMAFSLGTNWGYTYFHDYITIENNRMVGYAKGYEAQQGINLIALSNFVVKGNEFGHSGATNCLSCNTIEIHTSKLGLIENNYIHGATDQAGIAIKEGGSGFNLNEDIIVRYNYFYNNGRTTSQARGLAVLHENDGIYVYGNYFKNNQGTGYDVEGLSSNIYTWANIFEGQTSQPFYLWSNDTNYPGPNVYTVNNTFHGNTPTNTAEGAADITASACGTNDATVVFKNNIHSDFRDADSTPHVYYSAGTCGTDVVLEHNTYYQSDSDTITWRWGGSYIEFAALQSAGKENDAPTGEIANPSFTNASAGTAAGFKPTSATTNGEDLSGTIATITIQGVSYGAAVLDMGYVIDPNNTNFAAVPPTVTMMENTGLDRGAVGAVVESYEVSQTGADADLSVAEFNALSGDYSGTTFYFEGAITSQVTPAIYGTSGNPVVLDGYAAGDYAPKVGTNYASVAHLTNNTPGIALSSTNNYMVIKDFTFLPLTGFETDTGGAPGPAIALTAGDTIVGFELRNCAFGQHNVADAASVSLVGFVEDFVIDNNYWFSEQYTGTPPYDTKYGQNLAVHSAKRGRITNNKTYGGYTSMQMQAKRGTFEKIVVANNEFTYSSEEGFSMDMAPDGGALNPLMEYDTVASSTETTVTLNNAVFAAAGNTYGGSDFYMIFVDGGLAGRYALIESENNNTFTLSGDDGLDFRDVDAGDQIVISYVYRKNYIGYNTAITNRSNGAFLQYGVCFENLIEGNTITKQYGAELEARGLWDLQLNSGSLVGQANSCAMAPVNAILYKDNTIDSTQGSGYQADISIFTHDKNDCGVVAGPDTTIQGYYNTAIDNIIDGNGGTDEVILTNQFGYASGNVDGSAVAITPTLTGGSVNSSAWKVYWPYINGNVTRSGSVVTVPFSEIISTSGYTTGDAWIEDEDENKINLVYNSGSGTQTIIFTTATTPSESATWYFWFDGTDDSIQDSDGNDLTVYGFKPITAPASSSIVYDIDFTTDSLPTGCTQTGGTLNSSGWLTTGATDKIVCDAGVKIAKGYIEATFTVTTNPIDETKKNFFGGYEKASLDQQDYGDIIYARAGKALYDFLRWKASGDVMNDSGNFATEEDIGATSDWVADDSTVYAIRFTWDESVDIAAYKGAASIGTGSATLTEFGGFPVNEIRYAFLGGDNSTISTSLQGIRFKTFKMVNNTPAAPAITTKYWDDGALSVSSNGRYINLFDSTPFFLMADTAWTILYRMPLDKIEDYFIDRHAKGFNAIMTVVTGPGKIQGLDSSYNLINSNVPFIANDPTDPTEAFFAYLDSIINLAAEYNLYVMLLPAWGEYICVGNADGPVIFNETNAATYGTWIANRYKNYPNVIWVIGGDRTPEACTGDTAIYRAMANAINTADTNHLITFHPATGGSYDYFHTDTWLDFNLAQTYSSPQNTYSYIHDGYLETPAKPIFLGEPSYYQNPGIVIDGYYTALAQRIYRSQIFWSVLSGASGHVFGNTIVYIADRKDDGNNESTLTNNDMDLDWWDFTDTAGAHWTKIAISFFEEYDWWKLVPTQDTIITNVNTGTTSMKIAGVSSDADLVMVYFPTIQSSILKMDKITTAATATCKWFNPMNGTYQAIASYATSGTRSFTPPSTWEDAVLIMEAD